MVNRLVSVGDDFTLPAAVNAADVNLPERLSEPSLSATIATGVEDAAVNPTGVLRATFARKADGGTNYDTALGRFYARLALRATVPVPIVFSGSSTTQGGSASTPALSYVGRMHTFLANAYPEGQDFPVTSLSTAYTNRAAHTSGIKVVNTGIGGTTAANYLTSTTIPQVGALNPAMVVHMIGSNDFKNDVDPAVYKANVLAVMDGIDAAATGPAPAHLLLNSYARIDDPTTAYPWEAYGAKLLEIATEHPDRAAYVDLSTPFRLMGIPGTDPYNLLATDNIHTTDDGHALLAELVRQTLHIPTATAGTSAPAGPITVVDTFTGTDGTNLTAHAPDQGGSWAYGSGGVGPATIQGNKLRADGSLVALMDVGSANLTAEVDFTFPTTTPAAGIIIRASADGQTRLSAYWSDASNFVLSKITPTITVLATVPRTRTAGATERIKIAAVGDVITVFIDGVQVISHTLSSADQTTFGALTHIGLRASAAFTTAGSGFDNLNVNPA